MLLQVLGQVREGAQACITFTSVLEAGVLPAFVVIVGSSNALYLFICVPAGVQLLLGPEAVCLHLGVGEGEQAVFICGLARVDQVSTAGGSAAGHQVLRRAKDEGAFVNLLSRSGIWLM